MKVAEPMLFVLLELEGLHRTFELDVQARLTLKKSGILALHTQMDSQTCMESQNFTAMGGKQHR